MKKVLLATLATSLIASHSFAYEPINTTDYAKLAEQFKANELLDDLAETHGRTKGAITSELKKQGLIEG